MTTTKNTSSHTGEKKTPKRGENSGRISVGEFFRSRGKKVREVPPDDSVKVRIPFPARSSPA